MTVGQFDDDDDDVAEQNEAPLPSTGGPDDDFLEFAFL